MNLRLNFRNAMTNNRSDMSGWQRQYGDKRYVGGRRDPSPTEEERKRLAHEDDNSAHQANSGGLNWLVTLEKKDPKKAKQLQQTTQHPAPLRSVSDIADSVERGERNRG